MHVIRFKDHFPHIYPAWSEVQFINMIFKVWCLEFNITLPSPTGYCTTHIKRGTTSVIVNMSLRFSQGLLWHFSHTHHTVDLYFT